MPNDARLTASRPALIEGGGSFPGIAKALTGFGPLTIAATRVGIAAVILSGVALASGKGLPPQSTPVGRRI